jgi:hypothetical protein
MKLNHRNNIKNNTVKREIVMKKSLVILAAMAFVIAMVSGAYAGSIAPTVAVSASVQSQCTTPVNGVFAPLSIDPSSASNQPFTVTTPSTVRCTAGRTTPSITASSTYGTTKTTPATCSGALQTGFTMKEPTSGDTINYSFQCNTSILGLGFGSGSDVSLGIAATVLTADANAANYAAGATYSDTITLTVNY